MSLHSLLLEAVKKMYILHLKAPWGEIDDKECICLLGILTPKIGGVPRTVCLEVLWLTRY